MGLGFFCQPKRTGAEPVMHGITEEFLAGRLTLSRVLSGVCAALYLSLIFQPSSEDASASASFLLLTIQDEFSLGFTG